MSLISIIVPVYNVENYIHKCMDSILSQTYKNIEVILVDDGSPDNCPQICDSYATQDPRVKVIHKQNGGQWDAQNVGIDNASGDFIAFVDSDDFIHPKMYEILMKNLVENEADISVCHFQRFENEEECCLEFQNDVHVANRDEAIHYFFDRNLGTLSVVKVNKIYKSHLFKDIRFPSGITFDDECTTFKVFYNSNKVVYSNAVFYYYYQREGSITHHRTEKKIFDKMLAVEEYVKFFLEKKEDRFSDIAIQCYLIYTIDRYLESKKLNENEISQKIYELYQMKYKAYIKKLSYTWMSKMKFNIFYLSPLVFKVIVDFRIATIKLHKYLKVKCS